MRNYMLIFISSALLLLASGCRKEKLPPADDYAQFIQISTDLMCKKMLKCYEKLYRTVSVEMQKNITVENCSASVLENSDKKLAVHTPLMKSLSVKCYQTLLDAPCYKFAEVSLFSPDCAALRAESEKAYKNNSKKEL